MNMINMPFTLLPILPNCVGLMMRGSEFPLCRTKINPFSIQLYLSPASVVVCRDRAVGHTRQDERQLYAKVIDIVLAHHPRILLTPTPVVLYVVQFTVVLRIV